MGKEMQKTEGTEKGIKTPPREIHYLREMRQNYLMITAREEQGQGYETKMLIGNTIEGLLKFRVKKTENCCWFCYEITSKQPLSRLLETRSIGAGQIRQLLLGIARTLSKMEDYLLAEGLILLDPDYIYMDLDDYQPFLCLIPGKEGNFPEEFSQFLQFLLDKVDHQDKEAVILIYGLYRESLKENYGLDNLLRWLMKESCPDLESSDIQSKCEKMDPENIESRDAKEPELVKQVQWRLSWKNRRQVLSERQKASDLDSLEEKSWYQCLMPVSAAILAAGIIFLFQIPGLMKYGIWLAAVGIAMLAVDLFLQIWQIYSSRKNRKDGMPAHSLKSRDQSSYDQANSRQTTQETCIQPSCQQTSYGETSGNQQNYIPSGNQNFKELSSSTIQQESWQSVFDEQEETKQEIFTASDLSTGEGSLAPQRNKSERKHLRSLVSEDGGSDILLSYYPFIIGQQEGLCDYVLLQDTVSRLHMRVDETEGCYQVTDLNSTNGTYVNGRCLEANESILVEPGDEIGIAQLKFRFK